MQDDHSPSDEYTYPDQDDAITAAFVNQSGSTYARYWDLSERRILELMKRHIREALGDTGARASSLLDAGCGEGRLLPELLDLFDRIVAIDPDGRRLERARALVQGLPGAAKVELERTTVQKLSTPSLFDVVLSSHVLQHLHTEDVPAVLEALASRLRPGGLALITTCHSTIEGDRYEACRIVEGVAQMQSLSAQQFDDTVYASNDSIVSHYFTRASLVAALEAHGLSVSEVRVFHLREADLHRWGSDLRDWCEADEAVNRDASLQARHGDDMLIVARKLEE